MVAVLTSNTWNYSIIPIYNFADFTHNIFNEFSVSSVPLKETSVIKLDAITTDCIANILSLKTSAK